MFFTAAEHSVSQDYERGKRRLSRRPGQRAFAPERIMKSIRDIYKVGKGPSSSHTMGPAKAASDFRQETMEADAYRVTLYGSLSKTGKGHGTDRAVIETLAPVPTEVVFSEEMP